LKSLEFHKKYLAIHDRLLEINPLEKKNHLVDLIRKSEKCKNQELVEYGVERLLDIRKAEFENNCIGLIEEIKAEVD